MSYLFMGIGILAPPTNYDLTFNVMSIVRNFLPSPMSMHWEITDSNDFRVSSTIIGTTSVCKSPCLTVITSKF